MKELPMFPTYNGYPTIHEAASALTAGTVTLHEGETLFKEIRRVVFPGFMYDATPGDETPDPRAAVQCLRDYLKHRLEDRTYIMPHSSGYDSRLISALLRELGIRVIFVCWQPEVEATIALLKHMGWPARNVIRVGYGTVDYQVPALRRVGTYQSEDRRFIVGPGLANEVVGSIRPTISAAFADETLAFNTQRWPSVKHFHHRHVLDGPEPWETTDWVFPFVSREWITYLTEHRIEHADDFKRAMLEEFNLDTWPNQRYELAKQIKEQGGHDYARLSPDAQEEFGLPEILHSHAPEVRAFIRAAICDEVRKAGVTIR